MNQGTPVANPAGPAPAANPNDRASGSSSAIKNLADPNSPAPELWKVKPDPAAEQPAEITQDVLLHVPASFFGGEVVYPTAPSVYVAVGRNGDCCAGTWPPAGLPTSSSMTIRAESRRLPVSRALP